MYPIRLPAPLAPHATAKKNGVPSEGEAAIVVAPAVPFTSMFPAALR
jgi:hypothetical protein